MARVTTLRRMTRAVVVWHFGGCSGHRRGDVVSRHTTLAEAERKAAECSLWRALELQQ
jgi:hypothetical protein